MRVFIAIDFAPNVKEYLFRTVQELKKESIGGNFTRYENLHLTLAFLGEVSSKLVPDIMRVMEQAVKNQDSFELKIHGLGKFLHQEERLYWCGIRENEALVRMQQALLKALKESNFTVDDKPFRPHVTLGRRCRMRQSFHETEFSKKITAISMKVTKISLMKSEHKEGRLTYTSLGEVNLHDSYGKGSR